MDENKFVIDSTRETPIEEIAKSIAIKGVSLLDVLKGFKKSEDFTFNLILASLNKKLQETGENITVYMVKTAHDDQNTRHWICPIISEMNETFRSSFNLFRDDNYPVGFPAFPLLVDRGELEIFFNAELVIYDKLKFAYLKNGILKKIADHFKEVGYRVPSDYV